MEQERPILIIEDSHEDYEMFARAAKHSGLVLPIYRLILGSDTLDYLQRRMSHQKRDDEPLPRLILLDLHLPAASGQDLLAEIREKPEFAAIPIVVISSSANPEDVRASYAAGANSYIIKPIDAEEYQRRMASLLDYWINTVEIV